LQNKATAETLANLAKKIPWLLLAVLVVAAFLCLFALGRESLWLDEAMSVGSSKASLWSIAQTTASQDTLPPLYYFLLHLWMLLFGQTETAIRSLSACLGIVSVFLMYKVGQELFDRKTGLIASFLMAISAFALAYSQEARPYALMLMLTLLSFFLFIRILKTEIKSRAHIVLYTLVNILLAYTHIFGLFIIGAQVPYFILFQRRYAGARLAFWGAQAATVVAFSPWIYVLYAYTFKGTIEVLNWIPQPSPYIVARSMGSLAGAGYLWAALGVILVLIIFCLCLAGVFYLPNVLKQHSAPENSKNNKSSKLAALITEPRTALLLIWFLFPLAIALILSFAIRPIFATRYLIGITPVFYLLAARGIEGINSFMKNRSTQANLAAFSLIALVAVISAPGLYNYYAHPQKEQWREATTLIEQMAQPGDAVVFSEDHDHYPFDYYRGDTEISIVPLEVIEKGEPIVGVGRLWLVIKGYESTEDKSLKSGLIELYGNDSLTLKKEFLHVTVYLFDLKTEGVRTEQKYSR
jgi:mannosyltransferase